MSAFTRHSRPDPNNAALVFDGDCGFCTKAVEWMKYSLRVVTDAVAFRRPDLDSYGPGLADAQSWVSLVSARRQCSGAGVGAAVLRHQPIGTLRFLGWPAVAPLWVRVTDMAHGRVARYRYLLPGGTPAWRMASLS